MARLLPVSGAAALFLVPLGAIACHLDLASPRDAWTVEICCWDGDLVVGDTITFEAVAMEYFIGNGPQINSRTTPERYSWTSSNPAVATVDGRGHVRALALGNTTITATLHGPHSGRPGTMGVEVVPSVARLVMTLSADTIGIGETVQAQVAALDGVGNPVPGVIIWLYSSQELALVGAEASFVGTPDAPQWLAPARFTFRASAPGNHVIIAARPYMHPGMTYVADERHVVVR